MALRWYICDKVGTGTEDDPFRPALADLILGVKWEAVDGSPEALGWMLVRADTDDIQHTLLVADPRIRSMPFDSLDDTLGSLPASARDAAQAWCENNHVPVNDLTGSDTVRTLIKRIIRRASIRQILGVNDFSEFLDVQVKNVPAARRQAIKTRLEELGWDFSAVGMNDTIRVALRKLWGQNVRYNATMVD